MHSWRITLFIGIFLAITMVAAPHVVHATDIGGADIINATAPLTGPLLSTINVGLDLVRGLVTFVIGQVSFVLQAVINLQPGSGGDVVYTVWKNIRDFCNMGFIVVLILMSFGTIFDVFKWPFIGAYSINAKGVVANFLIAAVLMNFSLAIGQAVTSMSDQVTSIVIGILPTDSVGQLMGQLEIATLSTDPSISDKALLLNDIPADAQKVFQDCIIKNPSAVRDCYQQAVNKAAPQQAPSILSRTGSAIGDAIYTGVLDTITSGGYSAYRPYIQFAGAYLNLTQAGDAPTVTGSITQIMGKIYAVFLLMAALLSFLVVAVFMFIRIPITWVLLAISPIAFLSLAFPQSNNFGKWWQELITWSIFSPLYLLVIYFGMFMVKNMGLLIAALGSGKNAVAGSLALLLNFIVVGIVFIGGSKAVFQVAKGGGKYGGRAVEAVSSGLGVSGDYGAFGGVASGTRATAGAVSRVTGAQPYIDAGIQRVQQTKKDIGSELAGRYPRVFGGSEQALAKARQNLGVRGGDVEVEKLLKGRVDEQQAILKAQKATDAQLLDIFQRSQNQNAKIAAGKMLFEKGKLTDDERKTLVDLYGSISPVAKDTFKKSLAEQTQKEARSDRYADFDQLKSGVELVGKKSEDRRKFLQAAMAGEAGEKLSLSTAQMEELTGLMTDTNDKRSFLETSSKVGRNKVAAIKVQADLGLITDRNGRPMSYEQALPDKVDSLSDLDVLDAEDASKDPADPTRSNLQPILKEKLDEVMRNPKKFGKIISNVSDANQQFRILEQYGAMQGVESKRKKDIRSLEIKDRAYAERIKSLREKIKKNKKTLTLKRLAIIKKGIDDLEGKRIDFKRDMDALRKSKS